MKNLTILNEPLPHGEPYWRREFTIACRAEGCDDSRTFHPFNRETFHNVMEGRAIVLCEQHHESGVPCERGCGRLGKARPEILDIARNQFVAICLCDDCWREQHRQQ